jgi:hypothetical protein
LRLDRRARLVYPFPGAGVAELVDARDLKALEAIGITAFPSQTLASNPIKKRGTKPNLQNIFSASFSRMPG